MSVEVQRADSIDLEQWDRRVERSPHGTFFHQLDAVQLQADHADAEFHPLVGYTGEEPVGLFPVFEMRKGPVVTVVSPPPNLLVTYLGPVMLNMRNLSQRKVERRRRRFVEGCLEWLEREVSPQYVHVRTGGQYDDLRPFQWNDFGVSVDYTYAVDLSAGADALIEQFSSDARRNIRKTDETAYSIETGDTDDLREMLNHVRRRYESQGLSYRVPPSFVTDLAERFQTGVRPYGCRVDGELVGGIVALEYGDVVYRWQGGVRRDLDADVPVNDLLDWHAMTEGMRRGQTEYDLVGANNARINRYKAKFDPELRSFYSIERGSSVVQRLAKFYKRLV